MHRHKHTHSWREKKPRVVVISALVCSECSINQRLSWGLKPFCRLGSAHLRSFSVSISGVSHVTRTWLETKTQRGAFHLKDKYFPTCSITCAARNPSALLAESRHFGFIWSRGSRRWSLAAQPAGRKACASEVWVAWRLHESEGSDCIRSLTGYQMNSQCKGRDNADWMQLRLTHITSLLLPAPLAPNSVSIEPTAWHWSQTR